MIIKAGIKLYDTLQENFNAVSINSGVFYAREKELPKVTYEQISFVPNFEEGAVLPKQDWRPLNPSERKMLTPGKSSLASKTIFLGELPKDVIPIFKELKLADATSLPDIYALFRKNEAIAKRLNDKLNIFLDNLSGNKPYQFRCFGSGYPNLASVSAKFTLLQKNHLPNDAQFIGLHNDCTSEILVHTAHRFGNRISINLGRQQREFLFVNLSLIQAYNMIKKKYAGDVANVTVVTMPEIFFKLYPQYPVLKIRLNPYQYYIAPTNNCFHDAQTLGNKSLDITMVFFGAFFIN